MEQPQEVTVLMVPFPAQGHLNQLLHFALLLSSRGLPVHYAAAAAHIRQAKARIHGWDSTSLETIHFHPLPLPPFPTPPPDPNSTTNFPSHLLPSFEASLGLQAPLASLLDSLSAASRRLVIIHDVLMSFAGHAAAPIANAESYRFQCVPTFHELPHYYREPGDDGEPKASPEVLDLISASFHDNLPQEFWHFMGRHNFDIPTEAGALFNTSRAIERDFIDLYNKCSPFRGERFFAVGPLNPILVSGDDGGRHGCLQWLDKQPSGSVVYVSFGTTSTISDEQVEQLAMGLKGSGQRFIWVLRDSDRGDIFVKGEEIRQRELAPGFEEEVEGTGMVVRGWAPQLEILAHPSTGGFVSHCGWNSCMESLSMGVPILAWPMHSDQPRNAMMVTDYLKVGVAVREWGRRREVVSSEEIEEAIRKLMVGDQGKEMRKRAEALGEALRLAVSDGGSSKGDLDTFIAHVCR